MKSPIKITVTRNSPFVVGTYFESEISPCFPYAINIYEYHPDNPKGARCYMRKYPFTSVAKAIAFLESQSLEYEILLPLSTSKEDSLSFAVECCHIKSVSAEKIREIKRCALESFSGGEPYALIEQFVYDLLQEYREEELDSELMVQMPEIFPHLDALD